MGFFLCEFFMNQILMSWKHLVYQYIFTGFYALVTLVWQRSTGDAVIFPNILDWNSGDLFNECILWFIYFTIVQTVWFSIILLLHYLKSLYCCRRSVDIITYAEVDPAEITALRKGDSYSKVA